MQNKNTFPAETPRPFHPILALAAASSVPSIAQKQSRCLLNVFLLQYRVLFFWWPSLLNFCFSPWERLFQYVVYHFWSAIISRYSLLSAVESKQPSSWGRALMTRARMRHKKQTENRGKPACPSSKQTGLSANKILRSEESYWLKFSLNIMRVK